MSVFGYSSLLTIITIQCQYIALLTNLLKYYVAQINGLGLENFINLTYNYTVLARLPKVRRGTQEAEGAGLLNR